ncbi:hypothetical protein [Cohnella candidum]|uniref:Uncharacterized protein n=1 Tax=Cohnella candidum TaxID=2674991 RepID=A0A3G3K1R8_9BACL|nr:hypothetical protein [Cohnella candidum]AYQ74320.1 hypothetical protein EAV92_18160 [Cohnella candidum]
MDVGTRLLSEALIKKHHPHLRYVRIHTSGKNAVVIYAWNENLELPEADRLALRRFAAGYLPPYLCCQVKPYSMVREDGVPSEPEVPDSVREAAMNRNLDQRAILTLINGMFTGGEMSFDHYDGGTGTIYFRVRSGGKVTDVERELIRQYLYEVVPIGSYYEVAYS